MTSRNGAAVPSGYDGNMPADDGKPHNKNNNKEDNIGNNKPSSLMNFIEIHKML